MNISINKSDWVKVRLGDVAFEYSKRINNPSQSEYDRFVGSNNIGQWDFKVKSWEPTDSVTSAMKLFEPNDYLLVRRSLYASDFRERAPRAHFHGVCSGDILTIKENPKYIHNGFLIGILNSPDLWKYVVANGSGSITRRIHWKDLANYEFLLPPKSQQEEIANLLWSANQVLEGYINLENELKQTLTTSIDQFMIKGLESNNHKLIQTRCGLVSERIPTTELRNCLIETPSYGMNASSKEYSSNDVRYIRITDIDDEGQLNEDCVSVDSTSYHEYILEPNDLLVARTGNTVGKSYLYKLEDGFCAFAGYLIRFRVDTAKLSPEYLFYYTKSSKFEAFKKSTIKVGAQPNINSKEYQSMTVPIPAISEQNEIVKRLQRITKSLKKLRETRGESLKMQKQLITQIF